MTGAPPPEAEPPPTAQAEPPAAAPFVPTRPPRFWRLRRFARSLNPFTLLLGPVFQREMRVTGRRKGTYVVRFLVPAIPTFLVATFLFARLQEGRIDHASSVAAHIQSLQDIALTIALVVLWCHLVTLTLAAPLLTAGAIVEERTARTLSAIAASPITPGAIIGGVFTSRVVNLAILALLPDPILLAIRAFGGLETSFVLGAFAISACSALAAAAIGLWTSTRASRTAGAVSAAAVVVMGHWLGPILVFFLIALSNGMRGRPSFTPFLFSPPASLAMYSTSMPPMILGIGPDEVVVINCLVSLTIAGVALLLARRRLAYLIATDRVELVRKTRKSAESGSRTVSGNPVFWREFRQPLFAAAWKRWATVALVIITVLAIHAFSLNLGRHDRQPLVIIPSVIGSALLLLSASSVPAGLIAAEREAQTWATLLTTPLRPTQILLPKLAGAVRRLWPAYLFVLLHLALCVLRGVVSPLAIPFTFVQFTVFGTFLCATGVFFSLWCRKSAVAATLNLALALALWLFVPVCMAVLLSFSASREGPLGLLFFANPLVTFISGLLGFSGFDGMFETPTHRLSGPVFLAFWAGSLALYTLAAGAVILFARARFHPLATARL